MTHRIVTLDSLEEWNGLSRSCRGLFSTQHRTICLCTIPDRLKLSSSVKKRLLLERFAEALLDIEFCGSNHIVRTENGTIRDSENRMRPLALLISPIGF